MPTEIWNEAYNLLCDEGIRSAKAYLNDQVAAGIIDEATAEFCLHDIIETYNL